MVGLILGELGLDPELIAGEEIGNLRDGERLIAACDANVYLGSDEIEACGIGGRGCASKGYGKKAGGGFQSVQDFRVVHYAV